MNVQTQPFACELLLFPRYRCGIFNFVFMKVGRKAVIEELGEIEVLIKTGIPRSNSASGNMLPLLCCYVEIFIGKLCCAMITKNTV